MAGFLFPLARPRLRGWPGLVLLALLPVEVRAASAVRFLRFDEVEEILSGFQAAGAVLADLPDRRSWDGWIRARDREIRARIDRGAEDSISNLILYGTSFTSLPRIHGAEDAITAEGGLSEAARARVHAFALALARQEKNERLSFAEGFLRSHGTARAEIETTLAAHLSRFSAEQRAYQATLETAGKSGDPDQLLFTRSTLYHERGLSVDTSLVPNLAIEDTLRVMLGKGALAPGAVRRIAIIGPGLDFTDKRDGYDYYPLQTIQPFAMLEAAERLGLAAGEVAVTAFDLNPAVIVHIRGLAARARAGRAYTIQLPRDARAGWNAEALGYWQRFGEIIGSPAAAVTVPRALGSDVLARAVAIQPRFAARLDAADLDVVAETMDVEPGGGFDLVVATNILVYYDLFQQALAKAAIARMMNPGGVLLVNHALPSEPASVLEYLGRRSVSYSSNRAFGDDVVVYRRRKP